MAIIFHFWSSSNSPIEKSYDGYIVFPVVLLVDSQFCHADLMVGSTFCANIAPYCVFGCYKIKYFLTPKSSDRLQLVMF
jgi:hypothetical protein